MDLEYVVIARANGGNLAVTGVVLTRADADLVADDLSSSAGPGEDVTLLRAHGQDLVEVAVRAPSAEIDRIVAETRARRAV